jgi:PadR family transcriptional regulator, regulatory protein PadR
MAVRRSLTDLEFMILLAILRLNERAYGVMIGREIERRGRRTVSRAALYVALDRLEESGLVLSTLADSTPERGGRAKRYFTVTTTGLRAIQATQRAFVALWSGIRRLEDAKA